MNEWIAAYTALPNLHPALVHFPIVLIPLAAAFDLAAVLWAKGRGWLARAGALTWLLAALAAGATYWAGRQAADSLVGLAPQVLAHIGDHSDWGLYTLWAVALLAAVRLALARWQPEQRGALAVVALLGLGVTVVVLRTAELGGSLVFEHAVAVASPLPATSGESTPEGSETAAEPAAETPVSPPEERLHRTEQGGLEWRPLATDAAALGTILEPMGLEPLGLEPPSGAAEVSVAPAAEGDDGGLRLVVTGRSLLALPGSFDDVQVDAELDVSGFEGTVGLAHHIESGDRLGLLQVRLSDGDMTLVTLRSPDPPTVLDHGRHEIPSAALQLSVYAAGRHQRGMLSGETLVHGHAPPLPAGRVGLLVDGNGQILVRAMTVTPVEH